MNIPDTVGYTQPDEFAGSCSLEEVMMALKTHDAFFNVTTGIHERFDH